MSFITSEFFAVQCSDLVPGQGGPTPAADSPDALSEQFKAFSLSDSHFNFDFPSQGAGLPSLFNFNCTQAVSAKDKASLTSPASQKDRVSRVSFRKKKEAIRIEKQRRQVCRVHLLEAQAMSHGKKLKASLSFKKETITEEFLKTALGKKALHAVAESEKEKDTDKPTQQKLLELDFTNGTCKGQSYAIMVAFMKQNEDGLKLLYSIDKNHVLFFQATERFRDVRRIDSFSSEDLITCNYRVEQIALDVLEDLSGLRRVVKKQCDLLDKDFQENVTKIFATLKLEAIQISLIRQRIGAGHSVVALLGGKNFFYNSAYESGLYEYSVKTDLISDLFAYFARLQKEKNPLRYIVVNGFAQAKEESKKAI